MKLVIQTPSGTLLHWTKTATLFGAFSRLRVPPSFEESVNLIPMSGSTHNLKDRIGSLRHMMDRVFAGR